jgi:phosphotriesterase-related protein
MAPHARADNPALSGAYVNDQQNGAAIGTAIDAAIERPVDHALAVLAQNCRVGEPAEQSRTNEGGDLTRVVVGHIDAVTAANIPQLVAIAQRGVTLEFDLFGTPYTLSDPRLDARPMADAIVALVQAGYADRLLMSHDVCTKLQQQAYGGKGFDYLLTQVVPYLQQRGLSAGQVRTIMVDNPRRVLAFVAPR